MQRVTQTPMVVAGLIACAAVWALACWWATRRVVEHLGPWWRVLRGPATRERIVRAARQRPEGVRRTA